MNWPELKDTRTIFFDFDGVFTDNKVYLNEQGQEWVRCDRGDGLGFGMLKSFMKRSELTTDIVVLSKETNSVVSARARKLKLDCHQGIRNKLEFVESYSLSKFGSKDEIFKGLIYLGNDLNDLAVIVRAGFSVVPSDSHPLVQKHASVVLPQKGGDGFIRAFVEKLLKIDTLSLGGIHELISDC
jgi:3-deoxy-D-manno-octulosonate 8-phosphate phosphatase (KDO 8-P phosphatase)